MRGNVYGNLPAAAIRTYHSKRGTVTDHRTGLILPLKTVMDGDIENFIVAMLVRDND